MTTEVSSKIAKFAHDYRSRLLQEQGKTAAKMTKYDVALFMKKEGALTESEFNSWVKEKEGQDALQLSTQQQEALRRGTIFNFVQGMQSYLDSDEVNDFTLGNVLGFERTTNEKTGSTTIKSKEVSRKKFNVTEEMKKQSFYNYIKSLPTPQATYTELMRSIEFDKLDNKGKMEMMLKISGEKYNEAKEKGDKQAMKDYLLEGIGMALQLSCQKIDSTIGITQFKEWAKERTGLNFLVDLVDKYVDDGDEATLSWMEKNWEGVKGFGDALDSFIGTQAIAFIGALELAGAAAGTGAIGQVFNAATKAYFLYDGGKMMVDGATRYYNAETKQEARQAGTEFGMGTVIFTGTLKSVIGEIQAFRARHSVTDASGLPELSDGHKAFINENLSIVQNQGQVSTDLAFLQQNGVEIVKFSPKTGFNFIMNGKQMNIPVTKGTNLESGLASLVKNIKQEVVPQTKTGIITQTYNTLKEKIGEISIPFRLKSKMHDEFHITGNQIYIRKFSEYKAQGLTREQMLQKFFDVEKLSPEEIEQCYKWIDNIAETIDKIDKSFENVIPSLTPETYYRGIVEDADSRVIQIIQNAKAGDIITPDLGYSWLTPKESYARNYADYVDGKPSPENCVVMVIQTPAGAKFSRDISIDFSDGNILGISGMNPYSSMNVVTQRAVQYEVLGKEIKDGRTYITLKYLGPENHSSLNVNQPEKVAVNNNSNKTMPSSKAPSEQTEEVSLPTTPEGMKQAIADAKDWDSLRALNKGMKKMSQDVKEAYVEREQQLRTELSPEARGVVNWNIKTHMAVTEHALENYEGLSTVWKRYIARASELPDLDYRELEDLNAGHFYDALNEDPSYGTINDAKNNALSRFISHTEKAKKLAKEGKLEDFFKEVGYAIHYLQDGGTPPHTETGNYWQKLWRIPMHTAFERGKKIGATDRLAELKANYTPEEIPFSSLEMLFHNTALFTVQPENHVSYGNKAEWANIQQRCYDRSVNVSKVYLDYILQFIPKESSAKIQTQPIVQSQTEQPSSGTEQAAKIPDSSQKTESIEPVQEVQTEFSISKTIEHNLKRLEQSWKKYTAPIKYTWAHKKAFLDVERELTGHNTLAGYTHDLDKLILYAIGVPQKLAHQIHIINASHHIRNGHVKNPVQAVIDWECARITKPDKPLSAVDFYLRRNERIPEIEAVFDRLGLWTGYPETSQSNANTLTASSPRIEHSKVSVIAKPNQVEAVIPDLSASDEVLSSYGLVKDGNRWYAPNREEMPQPLTTNDIVIIGSRNTEGKPESVWFCSKEEFAKLYTNSTKYNNGEIEFINPEILPKGEITPATKCASGTVCVLPVGTKLASNEGVTTVDAGEIVIVNENKNSVYTTTFSKFLSKYNYDPLNPASKELFNLIEEYTQKESFLTEVEKQNYHEKITEQFNKINRAQKLCELSPLANENPPTTLRGEYKLATKISDMLETKYLSRIDVSNFNNALEQAKTVLNEIYQDTTLTQVQKDAAVTSVMVRLLPKTNSHQHLKGSVPEDVTLDVAKSKGYTEEQLAEIREAYAKSGNGYKSLNDFCANYRIISKPIKTPADYEMAIDGVLREAIKQGQIAVEIRCACDSWKDENGKFIMPDDATEMAIEIIERVKNNLKEEGLDVPKTGFVFLTSRRRGEVYEKSAIYQAQAAVNAAKKHPDLKFGYDVAGPEDTGHGPKDFAQAVSIIKEYNAKIESGELKGEKISITMHAGETPTFDNGRPGYLSVEEAIEMGVDRIGHGVQAVTNPKTMQKLKESGVTVEICGVCNIESVPANTEGLDLHPIDKFIEYGIPVTICTDNNAICSTDVSKEYLQFLLTGHGNFMDWNAVKQSARDGINSAFIPEAEKQEAITIMEEKINQIQNLVNSVANQYKK